MEEVSRVYTQTPVLHTLPVPNLSSKLKSLLSSTSKSTSIDPFSSIYALRERLIAGLNGIYAKYFADYLTYMDSYQPIKKNPFPSIDPALNPNQLSKLNQCVLQLSQEASSNAVYLLIYNAIEDFINNLWEQISNIPESEYKRQECLLAAYKLIEISAGEVNKLTQDILLYEMKIGIENISKLLFQEKVVDELDKIIDRGNTSLYLIRKEISFYKQEIRQMFNNIYSKSKYPRQLSGQMQHSDCTSHGMSIDELVEYIECKDNTSKYSRNRSKNSYKSTDSSSHSESPPRDHDKYALLEQEIKEFQIKLDSRPVQLHRFKLKVNPEWIESLRREIWARS